MSAGSCGVKSKWSARSCRRRTCAAPPGPRSHLHIDEPGFVPLGKTGAELLFELISQHYARGATFPLGDCCTITCRATDHRQSVFRHFEDVQPARRMHRNLRVRTFDRRTPGSADPPREHP